MWYKLGIAILIIGVILTVLLGMKVIGNSKLNALWGLVPIAVGLVCAAKGMDEYQDGIFKI